VRPVDFIRANPWQKDLLLTTKLIEPRTLKGFRDYPPALMIPREHVLQTAREVYRSYGYAPIDTPALEYAEVLLGKGGGENDRIVYRFKDHGDRDVALRFDLTVPFARFSAQHVPQLGTPFKRYAMGPVWRGENTSAGRYREFWQCDFDTIGTTSNAADIETVLVINDLFERLGFENFTIRINNRLILNGILENLGLTSVSSQVLRAIDKLSKIGQVGVMNELVKDVGISMDSALRVKDSFINYNTNEETLRYLGTALVSNSNPLLLDGYNRIEELIETAILCGIPENRITIDLSIARGLDYYTGTIYETFLTDLPNIGSVCSGGRYDNLAGLYTKQVLPGVGASLGVDRLLAAMEELKHPWMTGQSTPAPVIVLNLDASLLGTYQKIARELRSAGVGVEVYPDAKKLGPQFQYAERRGFRLAVIVGPEEAASGKRKVKDLAKREEVVLDAGEGFAAAVRTLLPG
jgi:histidyl-tRNA synthetase